MGEWQATICQLVSRSERKMVTYFLIPRRCGQRGVLGAWSEKFDLFVIVVEFVNFSVVLNTCGKMYNV